MSQNFKTTGISSYGTGLTGSNLLASQSYSTAPKTNQTGWTKTEAIPGGQKTTTFSQTSSSWSSGGAAGAGAGIGAGAAGFGASGNTLMGASQNFASGAQGSTTGIQTGATKTTTSYSSSSYGTSGSTGVGYGSGSGAGAGAGTTMSRLSANNYAGLSFTPQAGFQQTGERIISQHEMAPRLVSTKEGERTVVDVRAKEQIIKEERVFEGETRVVAERELKRERKSETRQMKKEEVTTEVIKKERVIEMIKEKPVPYETFVDVVYDVQIDVPIERTIERERIIEVTVEKPIEKIIEIPIEQIIEIPVEKIVEKPVETKRYVDKPFTTIKERPYDVIKENIIYNEKVVDVDERDVGRWGRDVEVLKPEVHYEHKQKIVEKPVYVDNIIEKVVEIKKPRTVEVPIEKIVEKKVPMIHNMPKPVDKVIEKEVEVPVEVPVYKDVEVIREVEVKRENIIDKPVPVERIVEKIVDVPVENIVEKPVYIDNIIEKSVDFIVEVPVPREEIVEVPKEEINQIEVRIEQVNTIPVEKLIRKTVPVIRRVEVPVDHLVEKIVSQPREVAIEKKVSKFVEVKVDKVIERPVNIERTVEVPRYVDKVIEVPVERIVENVKTVEKLIDKPIYIDTVLEKEVEHIVEKVVEVPVEKIIEVEVQVSVPRPVYKEHVTEEFINVDTETTEIGQGFTQEEVFEHDDPQLAAEIDQRRRELSKHEHENSQFKSQYETLKREFSQIMQAGYSIDETENIRLKARFNDISSAFRTLDEQRKRLHKKSVNRSHVTEHTIKRDPRVDALRNRMKTLIAENNVLVDNILQTGGQIQSIVQKNSTIANTNYGAGQSTYTTFQAGRGHSAQINRTTGTIAQSRVVEAPAHSYTTSSYQSSSSYVDKNLPQTFSQGIKQTFDSSRRF